MNLITMAKLTHSAHSYLCNSSPSHVDTKERKLKIPPESTSVNRATELMAGYNYDQQHPASIKTMAKKQVI